MSANDLILLLAVLGSLSGLWWVFLAGRRADLEALSQISTRQSQRDRNGENQ